MIMASSKSSWPPARGVRRASEELRTIHAGLNWMWLMTIGHNCSKLIIIDNNWKQSSTNTCRQYLSIAVGVENTDSCLDYHIGDGSNCINGDDGNDDDADHHLATSICVRYSRDLFVDCIKLSGRVQCAEDIFSNYRLKGRLLASVLWWEAWSILNLLERVRLRNCFGGG